MSNKNFRVFCAKCETEYDRKTDSKPICCENCGSEWIAVKEICKRCESDLVKEFCSNKMCYYYDFLQD